MKKKKKKQRLFIQSLLQCESQQPSLVLSKQWRAEGGGALRTEEGRRKSGKPQLSYIEAVHPVPLLGRGASIQASLVDPKLEVGIRQLSVIKLVWAYLGLLHGLLYGFQHLNQREPSGFSQVCLRDDKLTIHLQAAHSSVFIFWRWYAAIQFLLNRNHCEPENQGESSLCALSPDL